jgi:hypothetical protein
MKPLLLAAALLSLTSCGLFFVQADEPEVCKTFPNQQFDAAPSGFSGTFTYPPMSFAFGDQLPDFFKSDKFKATFRIRSVQMTAVSGVQDLSFIDAATLSLSAAGLPDVKVVNYTRAAGAPASATIDMVDAAQPDVFPYLESGNASGSFSMTGSLPSVSWAADIRVCFSAEAKFQYL